MKRLTIGWMVLAGLLVCAHARAGGVMEVDFPALVAHADLQYDCPASRSEEGMPIGNGRTGTLVWTSPRAVHMQVNRVDVFCDNSYTNSFPRSNTDYASGCAYVDVRVGEAGPEVFSGNGFSPHLSCYDGLMTTKGQGVSVRGLAWGKRDVIALEVEDRRDTPEPICVDLRMLRYALEYVRGAKWDELRARHESVVHTNAQTATSALDIRDGRILLTQRFQEEAFYNASGVAAAIIGRKSRAEYYNESTVRLTAEPGQGKFVILLGTASTFDSNADVGGLAVKELEAVTAGDNAFDQLLADNRADWGDYWKKSFIRLHSDDGVADFLEQNYTYFLYVMGASSRGGKFPPRFGGMLWYTNGDMRAWGSLYWWANQSCYFNGLMPANRPELMAPTFAQYSAMYDACALAAKQQWGSQGIWIPETTFWNGPAKLPDDIAAEMRDLYLLRKPWEQRSARFEKFADTKASFESRWNWIAQGGHWEDGYWIHQVKQPPFGHVTHIFGTTAKIAYLYWLQYEYTMDERWLRERAYPMLRGVVEFYRNFPNLKKEADGRYHIHGTNSNEPAWGVKDSDEDLSAMHGTVPLLLRASEILNVDAGMRPVWKEFLDHLAPLPTSDKPDALKPADYSGPTVWVKGLKPAVKAGGLLPDPNTLPEWNFDLCTPENPDPAVMKVANATFDGYFRRGPIGPGATAGTLSRLPIAAAALGRADAVKYLVPAQVRQGDVGRGVVMANRLALREGPGATECERLGRAAEAIHTALLQSIPPTPGEPPVIRVFPAWPKEWDATFELAARGGFVVGAKMDHGRIAFVEITSNAGGDCRLRNPWGGQEVTVCRDGKPVGQAQGSLLVLKTSRGEATLLVPNGNAVPPTQQIP